MPDGVPTGVTVLQQPLDQSYLVAAAAMDYFDKLNAIDCITLSGKKQSDWYIQCAKDRHGPRGAGIRRQVLRAGL